MDKKGVNLRSLTPLILYAGAAALLFYSGLFAFMFAVPVQVAFSRRGKDYGVGTAVATALVIAVFHILQSSRFDNAGTGALRIMFLDSLMPIGLLAGVSVFNVARRYDWWMRLAVATGIAILGALPSLRLLQQAASGDGAMAEQLTSVLAALGIQENAGQWILMVQRVIFNSVGVGLMVSIATSWWIGRNIAWRGAAPVRVLQDARIPDGTIWAVIGGLSVVLFAWLRETPAMVEIVGWNTLLIAAFLFAVQGIGLAQHLLARRGVGPIGERWVLTGVLVSLFLPGLNVFVSIGLPLFGMSKLWIDYKRGESDESNSE